MQTFMTRQQAAESLNTSATQVWYWELRGLLKPAAQLADDRPLFDPRDVKRVAKDHKHKKKGH